MYNEREEERDEHLSHHHFYAFLPAVCNERPEFLLCKKELGSNGNGIISPIGSNGLNYLAREDTIEASHEMIDRALGTNSAWHYTQELKEILAHLNINPTIAMAPPPATVGGAVATIGTATRNAIAVQEAVTIYRAFNQLTGEMSYVRITNNFERRFGEHLRNKDIEIVKIRGLDHLSREDARAVEQTVIELHKLEKDEGTLINKINSIAKSNPEYENAIRRGGEILEAIIYEGAE